MVSSGADRDYERPTADCDEAMLPAELITLDLGGAVMAVVVVVGAIAGVVAWAVRAYNALRDDMRRIEAKADAALLAFHMNAKQSASDQGRWGTMNSPFVPNQKAREAFATSGWTARLIERCDDMQGLDEAGLVAYLHRNYRQELADTICKDFGFREGECIAIAYALIREIIPEPPNRPKDNHEEARHSDLAPLFRQSPGAPR